MDVIVLEGPGSLACLLRVDDETKHAVRSGPGITNPKFY